MPVGVATKQIADVWRSRRGVARGHSQRFAAARARALGRAAARRRCASRSRRTTLRATVGKFLGISAGAAIVVGVITKIDAERQAREGELATCALDMLGEIKNDERQRQFFQRGVTEYPMIGDPVDLITQDELRLIFDMSGPGTIDIGTLQQDRRSPPTSTSTTWCASISRCSAPPASASRAASRCWCARSSTRGRTCACS